MVAVGLGLGENGSGLKPDVLDRPAGPAASVDGAENDLDGGAELTEGHGGPAHSPSGGDDVLDQGHPSTVTSAPSASRQVP